MDLYPLEFIFLVKITVYINITLVYNRARMYVSILELSL